MHLEARGSYEHGLDVYSAPVTHLFSFNDLLDMRLLGRVHGREVHLVDNKRLVMQGWRRDAQDEGRRGELLLATLATLERGCLIGNSFPRLAVKLLTHAMTGLTFEK